MAALLIDHLSLSSSPILAFIYPLSGTPTTRTHSSPLTSRATQMAAVKWWCVASLLLCLAVAAASARDVPRDDCDTATFAVPEAGVENMNNDVGVDRVAGAVDEAKTAAADAYLGRTGGGLFGGGVHGPLGGGVAGFGPFGGAVAGAGPFGGFGGGGGLGGGGGGGGGGIP